MGDDGNPAAWECSPWRSFMKHRCPEDAADVASNIRGRLVLTQLFREDVKASPDEPKNPNDIFGRALEVARSKKSFVTSSSLSATQATHLRSHVRVMAEDNHRWGTAGRSYEQWRRGDAESDEEGDAGGDDEGSSEGQPEEAEESYAPLSPAEGPAAPTTPTPPGASLQPRPPHSPATLRPLTGAARAAALSHPTSARSCPSLALPTASSASPFAGPAAASSPTAFSPRPGVLLHSPSAPGPTTAAAPAAGIPEWTSSPHTRTPSRTPSRLQLCLPLALPAGAAAAGSASPLRSPAGTGSGAADDAARRPKSYTVGAAGSRLLHVQLSASRRSADLVISRSPLASASGAGAPPLRGAASGEAPFTDEDRSSHGGAATSRTGTYVSFEGLATDSGEERDASVGRRGLSMTAAAGAGAGAASRFGGSVPSLGRVGRHLQQAVAASADAGVTRGVAAALSFTEGRSPGPRPSARVGFSSGTAPFLAEARPVRPSGGATRAVLAPIASQAPAQVQAQAAMPQQDTVQPQPILRSRTSSRGGGLPGDGHARGSGGSGSGAAGDGLPSLAVPGGGVGEEGPGIMRKLKGLFHQHK